MAHLQRGLNDANVRKDTKANTVNCVRPAITMKTTEDLLLAAFHAAATIMLTGVTRSPENARVSTTQTDITVKYVQTGSMARPPTELPKIVWLVPVRKEESVLSFRETQKVRYVRPVLQEQPGQDVNIVQMDILATLTV